MSLFSILDVAGSGMRAQNVRLNLIASNLANADSIGPDENSVYRARHPIFASMLKDQFNPNSTTVGVTTIGIVESQVEPPMHYDPDHPLSNDDGYVFSSNVDSIEEMTNMISASRSYQMNAEMLSASKEILLETLKIGQ